MFKLMGKEINAILGAQTILIWTYATNFGIGILFSLHSSDPLYYICDTDFLLISLKGVAGSSFKFGRETSTLQSLKHDV